jgi:beta-lactam-binding protein with PASTA domain
MWLEFKKYNNSTLGGVLINLAMAVGIIILLAVVYFYAYLPSITNHNESITVPNIEGMTIEKLEDFLGKRNLRWEVNDSSYSPDAQPLTVLKQFPHLGSKVKENRKIYISINRINPPTVPLPRLIEVSLTNADAILRSNDLKRGRVELVSGPWLNYVKEAKFEGAKIETGTRIPKGSVIDLVVMDGGNTKLSTPNVINYSLEDAKLLIFGSNLNIGEIKPLGDTTGMHPVIIKQKPSPGEVIKVGDIIDIWIAKPGTEPPDDDDEEIDEEI